MIYELDYPIQVLHRRFSDSCKFSNKIAIQCFTKCTVKDSERSSGWRVRDLIADLPNLE